MPDLDPKTLELIQQTAREAQTAKIIDVPGDGRTCYVQVGKELQEFTVVPDPRHHVVDTLADLVGYAIRANKVVAGAQLVAWHGERAVCLVLDDNDRRDSVCFPLSYSAPFEVLVALTPNTWFDQQAFIRLLRLSLGLDNTRVVQQFRRLDWQASSENQGVIEKGKESLSKSMLAEVQGVDELPDELAVELPIYANPGEDSLYRVRCAVEINPRDQMLALVPLPNEIDRAKANAQFDIDKRLHAGLDKADVPIYFGQP